MNISKTLRASALLLSVASLSFWTHASSNQNNGSTHTSPLLPAIPAKPAEKPLPWVEMAHQFNTFIMNPANGAMKKRPDGCLFFPSDLQGTSDELTTYGPVTLGKILRKDNDIATLLPSFDAFFNPRAGLFLNGTHGTKIEHWYLFNVDALAAGIIRTRLNEPKYKEMQRSTADALIRMARQLNYDFNQQGYDFDLGQPWTNKDIFRQPDAIGGYAYLMLISYELLGDSSYLDEAVKAIGCYQSFDRNPWYEIPSGAMASLTAARLQAHYGKRELELDKIIGFALDPQHGPLQTGSWGGKEVNGLMRGWGGGDRYEAYSMETLVAPVYLLPVLRYQPAYAAELGRYFLNLAANMRYFYSDALPRQNQSRPDLPAVMPYERLAREEKGLSPYAGGDYGSQRSIYGGAYALWMGQIIKPTVDPFILGIDIAQTDFLAARSYPTLLYYNPYDTEKSIDLDLPQGTFDLYETTTHRIVSQNVSGSARVKLPAGGARIVVLIPSGAKREVKQGVVCYDSIEVDYSTK